MIWSISLSAGGEGSFTSRPLTPLPASFVAGSPGATVTSSGVTGATFGASVRCDDICGPVDVTVSLEFPFPVGLGALDLGGSWRAEVVLRLREVGGLEMAVVVERGRGGTGGRRDEASADERRATRAALWRCC